MKRAVEAIKKKKRKKKMKRKKKGKKRKKKENKKRGQHYYLLSTFVLMFSTYIHMREFSCFTSITMWGIYTIELGLYIPMMSLLKSALGLREQPSWMHPH